MSLSEDSGKCPENGCLVTTFETFQESSTENIVTSAQRKVALAYLDAFEARHHHQLGPSIPKLQTHNCSSISRTWRQ